MAILASSKEEFKVTGLVIGTSCNDKKASFINVCLFIDTKNIHSKMQNKQNCKNLTYLNTLMQHPYIRRMKTLSSVNNGLDYWIVFLI